MKKTLRRLFNEQIDLTTKKQYTESISIESIYGAKMHLLVRLGNISGYIQKESLLFLHKCIYREVLGMFAFAQVFLNKIPIKPSCLFTIKIFL